MPQQRTIIYTTTEAIDFIGDDNGWETDTLYFLESAQQFFVSPDGRGRLFESSDSYTHAQLVETLPEDYKQAIVRYI